jgi:DNA-binding protein H-NS
LRALAGLSDLKYENHRNMPLCNIHSVYCLCFDTVNLLRGTHMAKRRKQNLAGLDFESLMALRTQVDEALTGYRSTLERQLEALASSVASLGGKVARGVRGRTLKGTKVAPKYRSPDGDTWAGRGATPRWLKAAIKEGKKLEDFAIEKTVGKAKKARRKKK